MKTIITLILCTLLSGIDASSQILNPAKWDHKVSKKSIHKGDTLELVFSVELHKNWHLFSNIQDYDLGPLPTTFEFEPHGSYKLLGEVRGIGFQREYDPVFEVDVNFSGNNAEFKQKVLVLSVPVVVKGTYEYQVCNTVDGKCILGSDDFEYKIQTIK